MTAVSKSRRLRQRGISLIVVLVMLLLTSIVVLGVARVGWLNESFVGNTSDYQRTFAAAEALMRDAELDIKGVRTDGTPCVNDAAYVRCRNAGAGEPFFPIDDSDIDTVRTIIGGQPCNRGICVPTALDSLGNEWWKTNLVAMSANALAANAVPAVYGQFTRQGAPALGTSSNQLLEGNPRTAWYWVEVFRYELGAAILAPAGRLPVPDVKHPFVYRITVVAQGRKPGSRVVLRSVFVPNPQNQNK